MRDLRNIQGEQEEYVEQQRLIKNTGDIDLGPKPGHIGDRQPVIEHVDQRRENQG